MLQIALVEWPIDLAAGHPRIVGRTADPELVEAVRDRLAAERRRSLAELESPVRAVPDLPEDDA